MSDESPKEEILINVTPREVRAALLENGVLQDIGRGTHRYIAARYFFVCVLFFVICSLPCP